MTMNELVDTVVAEINAQVVFDLADDPGYPNDDIYPDVYGENAVTVNDF